MVNPSIGCRCVQHHLLHRLSLELVLHLLLLNLPLALAAPGPVAGAGHQPRRLQATGKHIMTHETDAAGPAVPMHQLSSMVTICVVSAQPNRHALRSTPCLSPLPW